MTTLTIVVPLRVPRSARVGLAISVAILVAAALVAAMLFPDNFFYFRPAWLLHPFEQEHLAIARNLAHGQGFTIEPSGIDPAHGAEDRGVIGGRYVPRGMILPYLIYSVPFFFSETAWLLVTPIFGLLAAVGAGFIVHQRTRSAAGGLAAAAALYFSSPFLLSASGLVFDNLIALAFLLWGIYAIEAFLRQPSPSAALAAGTCFAALALTRADYAPATVLFVGVMTGRQAWIWWRHRGVFRGGCPLSATVGVAIACVGILGIFATNLVFTGNPLHSSYGAAAWQGSVSGIANQALGFQAHSFLRLAVFFLWDIGRPSLVLFAAGVVLILLRRRLFVGDLIFLGLSAFLILLHLGRSGLNAENGPILVSSPPRYLLPVYATGIIIGFTMLAEAAGKAFSALSTVAPALLLALGLVAATGGLAEAYGNEFGTPYVDRTVKMYRFVHDFSAAHEDAYFVGDLNTLAIIDTPLTLMPRHVGSLDTVNKLIHEQLQAGRSVFMVDDRRQFRNNQLYSGYYENLSRGGLSVCLVTDSPWQMSQIFSDDQVGKNLVFRTQISSLSSGEVVTPRLDQGKTYFVLISGTFAYNGIGSLTDGIQARVDGRPLAAALSPDHRYCMRVRGKGDSLRLSLQDSTYSDNRGSLTAAIFTAD